MNRTLRFAASSALVPAVLASAMLTAPLSLALPNPKGAEGPALESKLGLILGRQGGLTSAVVAARAEATSFDVKAKKDELEAAAAGVDQALVGYFPRLNLTARYTRLSPITQGSLGNLVLAPTPLPPGSGHVPGSGSRQIRIWSPRRSRSPSS